MKLGDCVEVISKHISGKDIRKYLRFVGLEHYDTGEVDITRWGKTDMLESAVKEFSAGDVLVARRNVYLKRASAVKFDGVTSGDSIVLRAHDPSVVTLLPFVLNTDAFWNFADQHADGTMSKRLSPKVMLDFEFSLPPLNEQKKLAETLWAMERVKRAYKKLLAETDRLLEARFVEMFGIPNDKNEKCQVVELGDIAFITKLAGYEYTEHIKYKDHGDIIMVRGLNCKKMRLILDDIFWIDKVTSDALPRSKLSKGDLVFTYVGTVGEVALIDKNNTYHLAPNVAKIELNDKHVNIPEFWAFQLMFARNYILKFASATTQAALSMGKIRKIRLPMPATDLQREFAAFVEQAEKSKASLKESLAALTVAQKALMNEAFKVN